MNKKIKALTKKNNKAKQKNTQVKPRVQSNVFFNDPEQFLGVCFIHVIMWAPLLLIGLMKLIPGVLIEGEKRNYPRHAFIANASEAEQTTETNV